MRTTISDWWAGKLGLARQLARAGRIYGTLLLALALLAAPKPLMAGGTKGYGVIVNNDPVEVVYVTDTRTACALVAGNVQYVLFFNGQLPVINLGSGANDAGNLECYVLDDNFVVWKILSGPIECEGGYTAQRGSCTQDPDRGIRNSGGQDPEREGKECGASPEVGNSISLSSSGKIEDVVDFDTAGPQPLVLKRHYRSRGAASWRLGGGRRRFDFEYGLSEAGSNVTVLSPDGAEYLFNETAPSIYASAYNDVRVKLTKTTNPPYATYEFTDENDRTVRLEGTQGTFWPRSIIERNGDNKSLSGYFLGQRPRIDFMTFGDNLDRRIEFTYDTSNGLPTRIKEAVFWTGSDSHFKIVYGYTNDILTTVTRFAKSGSSWQQLDQTTYHYEKPAFKDLLTGITDARGIRYASWSYDEDGRPTSSEHFGGVEKTSISYNDTLIRRTVTNALGKQTTYRFDKREDSVKLKRVDGIASLNCPASTRTLNYNSAGNITQITDEELRATVYARDAVGRPTAITRGHGSQNASTTNITYHATLNVPIEIAEPGLVKTFTWTDGKLAQVTQRDTATNETRTWTYAYTGTRLISVDGPLPGAGDTVLYEYDSDGYLKKVTNEVGHVTTVNAVNYRGQPTSITDANSVETSLTYDDLGRLKTVTVDPGGAAAVTSIDYNAVGDVEMITRPNGAILDYEWDEARRLVEIKDNLGAYVELEPDLLRNIKARRIKDANGALLFSQTAVFDELGRLQKVVGAGGQTWTLGRDKTDNVASITDPRLNAVQRSFDPLNRLIGETDEDNEAVTLTRNGRDEITAYTDPRLLATGYVRNGFGDVVQRTSPDSGTTSYEYNALGRATRITDARGAITNLTYDNAGRLATKTFPANSEEGFTLTWDGTEDGNKGKGRLTRAFSQDGEVFRKYDQLGHTIQERKVLQGVTYTVKYTYDDDGNVTEMVYPSGRIVTYARDAVGRISGITTKASASSPTVVTLASNVLHLDFGPLRQLTYGNNLILSKHHTNDYRLDVLRVRDGSGANTLRREHVYGDGINITSITESAVPGRDESYAYTATNRVQDAGGIWGALTYHYDGVGNRTHEILDPGSGAITSLYGYPANSNRLSNVTQGSTTIREFTHDAAGNITLDNRAGTEHRYLYNERGRLKQHRIANQVRANYRYDFFERLDWRETLNMTPAGTTHYVQDLAGQLIVEATGAGTMLREYVWLDDMPIAVFSDLDTAAPQLYFVHPDHLNRPLRMTDGTRAVVWDAVYRPFGEVHSIAGSATLNLRFPGQYFLLENGLHYNWHRHYDPTIGRYTQPDPLEFVDGPSLYAYAWSAPTQYVDPEGRWVAVPIIFGVAGFAIDVTYQYFATGCIDWKDAAVTGLLSAAGGTGGFWASGIKRAGTEFSHWIPRRKGGPRSVWNGNYVSPQRHYYNDPFRYPPGWRDLGEKLPAPLQQFDRIPDMYKTAAASTGLGTALGNGCTCGR
jgi:RHS repeat-associated protein